MDAVATIFNRFLSEVLSHRKDTSGMLAGVLLRSLREQELILRTHAAQ